MLDRRTKIVATLGPSTDAAGVLDDLVASGMDCARLNCSHGTHDDLRRRAADVREAGARAGRALGLLFDLQGPKLRLGGDIAPREVRPGDTVVFSGAPDAGGISGRVAVEFDAFSSLVSERSEVVIGDGVPRFTVDRVEGDDVVTRAVSPGRILPRKGINVTYA